MRVLIGTEDKRNMMYVMPWSSDGTCFNFKAPTKHIKDIIAKKER